MENFWKMFRKLLGNIWEIIGKFMVNLWSFYFRANINKKDLICDVEKVGGERAGPGRILEFTGRSGPKSIGKRAGSDRKIRTVLISSPHLLYGEASIYQIHGTEICHV